MWRVMTICGLCLGVSACAAGGAHRLLPSEDIDNEKIVSVNRWAESRGGTRVQASSVG